MTTTLTVVLWVALAVSCGLHLISFFLDNKIGKIVNFVNIALHIAYIPVMLFAKFKIDLAVLVYMISVFVYTLPRFIQQLLKEKRDEKEDKV